MDNTSKQGETYCGIKYQTYTITLSSKRNFMLITIAYFADKMSKDINDTQSGVEDFLQHSECQNIEIHDRTIDNQSGVLGVGENSNGDSVFAAQYWPTFDASCDTNVLIESNYPWANETLSLLKTIHIEQIGDSTNLIPR